MNPIDINSCDLIPIEMDSIDIDSCDIIPTEMDSIDINSLEINRLEINSGKVNLLSVIHELVLLPTFGRNYTVEGNKDFKILFVEDFSISYS